MYNRFKNWVNDSYVQLQMARGQWDFKTKRASVFLNPAIYVEKGTRAGDSPSAGAVFEGDDTEFTFELLQAITHSGDWTLGTAKATLYFLEDYEGADFKFNEKFSELSPVPTGNVFIAKGWGRYDFSADGQLTDISKPLEETFMIGTTGGSTIQDNDEQLGLEPLVFVDWSKWQDSLNGWAGGRGKPRFITRAPDGDYEVWPRPDRQYVLNFTYTSTDGTMTLHNDIPNIPTRYHPLIMWMAVEKAGMYERSQQIVARAQKEIKFYRERMETDHMPRLSFGRSIYNYE